MYSCLLYKATLPYRLPISVVSCPSLYRPLPHRPLFCFVTFCWYQEVLSTFMFVPIDRYYSSFLIQEADLTVNSGERRHVWLFGGLRIDDTEP